MNLNSSIILKRKQICTFMSEKTPFLVVDMLKNPLDREMKYDECFVFIPVSFEDDKFTGCFIDENLVNHEVSGNLSEYGLLNCTLNGIERCFAACDFRKTINMVNSEYSEIQMKLSEIDSFVSRIYDSVDSVTYPD